MIKNWVDYFYSSLVVIIWAVLLLMLSIWAWTEADFHRHKWSRWETQYEKQSRQCIDCGFTETSLK